MKQRNPVIILGHAHSGTKALTEVLHRGGVYMGDKNNKGAVNPWWDSLIWAFQFRTPLVARYFKYGHGCIQFPKSEVISTAKQCYKKHMAKWTGGPWGFKVCNGAFAYQLFEKVFDRPKYIYIVRDGRDVILSNGYRWYLTGNPMKHKGGWEYYSKITFGISNDRNHAPFKFPKKPGVTPEMLKNGFWVQAKAWMEHHKMFSYLRWAGWLNEDRYFKIRYEDLCSQPNKVLMPLFDFLGVQMPDDLKGWANKYFTTNRIGKWKEYRKHCKYNHHEFPRPFKLMQTELSALGYYQYGTHYD